jgi:hypothetical protein
VDKTPPGCHNEKIMEKWDRRNISAPWRHASESWLRRRSLILPSIKGKVLTRLLLNLLS